MSGLDISLPVRHSLRNDFRSSLFAFRGPALFRSLSYNRRPRSRHSDDCPPGTKESPRPIGSRLNNI
uniref:Uncharacterized protein n=1 Tax=Picea glauca TaxID=3330 RepID=A0A101M1W7_PICGL|nr:hypothetical protein ABT39_MTgene3946 [Picea glauca]